MNKTHEATRRASRVPSERKHPMSTSVKRVLLRIAPTFILLIILGVFWQLAADSNTQTARIWSSPTRIWEATSSNWDSLWTNLSVTTYEALCGFALAIVIGITLGVILYLSSLMNAALMPLLTAAQTLPLISVTPFFLWWFGFDEAGKIALVTVFSIFPITIQTSRGLRAVPRYFTDVALTCGATRSWALWHVQIRVAARQIFSGIRIAGTYIFATAATAEYMGSRKGIGIFLQSAYNSFQSALVWSATLSIIAVTGILMIVIIAVEHAMIGNPSEDSID